MIKKVSLFILLGLFLGQCKRNDFTLGIQGKVNDDILGGTVAGVEVELEVQILEGGIFNSTFQPLDSQTSAADGSYGFSFDRENAVEYRLTTSKDGYITRQKGINPDNLAPGEVLDLDLSVVPRATFEVTLQSAWPNNEFDYIKFKNLGTDFVCACCDGTEQTFPGTSVDTTFSCDLYGETWLKYFVEVDKDSVFYSYIDSLYCPAFETSSIQITY